MRVKVRLLGVVSSRAAGTGRSVDLVLGDDVTVGDLLRALADRFGSTFRELVEASDGRLPRHVRMFAGSEMLVARDQPLAPAADASGGVTVVMLSPMMGG